MPLSPFPLCPISASLYLAQQSNNEQRGLSQKPIPTCLFTTAASQYGLCCWVFLFKCLLRPEEAWHSVEAVFDKASVVKGLACITSHTHRTPASWQMNPESSLWKRKKSLYLYMAEWQLAPFPCMLPSLNKVVNAVASAKTPTLVPKTAPSWHHSQACPAKTEPRSFRLLWKGCLQSGQPTLPYMLKPFFSLPNSLGVKEGLAWAEAAPQEGCEDRRESHKWQMEKETRGGAAVMNHCKGISPAGCKDNQTARTRGKSEKEMRVMVQCCCSRVPITSWGICILRVAFNCFSQQC